MKKKKSEMSEFAKYVIENNLALPVEEAFKRYPVEEENYPVEYHLKGYSEFVKYVFANNKVKTLRDFFKEQDDNFKICEDEGIYFSNKQKSKYKIGDIISVKTFKYPNGSIGTKHPFVIIDKLNLSIPIDHLSMLISSQQGKLKFKANIFIAKTNKTKLKRDSHVKTDYIYHIHESEIIEKIGCVDKELVALYKKSYFENKKIKKEKVSV